MRVLQRSFYVTGGTLRRDAPSYVPRQADDDLYAGLTQGRFCYVLTSRQMGKSSLMVRTAARLREEGNTAAVIDLTEIGQNLTVEQWYKGLLGVVGEQLALEDELADAWCEHDKLGPLQRWMRALRQVVLARSPGRVVIFVDEIDAVRSLPFSTDEFFAGIRELYNRRAEDPELARLTFCLLGVASPSDLIREARTTPFNIGERIELTDFTEVEAAPLAQGLGTDPAQGEALLGRILYWTGGHPYLTQRLCQAVADSDGMKVGLGVDLLCDELFLSPGARRRDDNLLFVSERVLRSEGDLAGLLELYGRVHAGRRVPDDETSPLVSVLRLSGITRVEGGYLKVRNRIYDRVFNGEWVAANMPDAEVRRQRTAFKRGLARATAVAVVVLVLMGYLVVDAWRQRSRAEELRALAEKQGLLMEREKTINRRLLYAAHMNLAYQAWERGDFMRAVELLDEERPKPGEVDLRGFEYYYLWRLCHAERLTMAHGADVQRVAFSPDGRVVAAASSEGVVKLWDAATGRELRTLAAPPAAAASVAFSPDGATIATGGVDGTIRLWDAAGDREVGALAGHDGPVVCLAFSPDGSRLASGVAEATVELWDVGARRAVATMTGFRGPVDLSFSPDGARLATSCADGSVKVWDAVTARELYALADQVGFARAAVSPDGRTLATSSADGTVKLWDAATGRERAALQTSQGGIFGLAFSPDGAVLALGNSSGTVELWEVEGRVQAATLPGHAERVAGLAFSPDGRTLATGSADGTIKLWDARKAPESFTTLEGHSDRAYTAAFSPDGRRLASGGFDNAVILWDVASGRQSATLEGHTDMVRSVAFSPDGAKLASAASDRTVRLWDAATGRPEAVLAGHTEQVFSVAFSPRGSIVASGSFDGTVKLWDVATGRELRTLGDNGGAIECVAFSPDGRLLAAGGEGQVATLWDVETGARVLTLAGHTSWVNALAFSPDGGWLATVGSYQDSTVRIWDVATGKQLLVIKGLGGDGVTERGQGGRANAVAFAPSGTMVAVGTVDSRLKMFDVVTGQELSSLSSCHSGRIYAVTFAPGGHMLATAGEDSLVKLWRAATPADLAAGYAQAER